MVDFQNEKLYCNLISNYCEKGVFNIEEGEILLKNILQRNPSDIRYIIQYVLVLLNEPILDYETAFEILKESDDIKSILLRNHILDWYFGVMPEEKLLLKCIQKESTTKAEWSMLYYYVALGSKDVLKKIEFLKLSLEFYPYNLMSIVTLKKNGYVDVDLKYRLVVKLINRLRRRDMISKTFLYKPFLYSRLLGLDRDDDNLKILEDLYFKSNSSQSLK